MSTPLCPPQSSLQPASELREPTYRKTYRVSVRWYSCAEGEHFSSPLACVLLWSPGGEADQGTPLKANTFFAPRIVGRSPRWAGMGTPSHLPGHPVGTVCRRQRTVYAPRSGTQNSLTDYRRINGEPLSTVASDAAWVLSESNPKDYPETATGQFTGFANRPGLVWSIAGCQRPIVAAVFPELVTLCIPSPPAIPL